MSKSEIQNIVVDELGKWWFQGGQIHTVTPREVAVDLRVPVKLAKAALKGLHRAGKLHRCSCCGCYSLADELLS